MANRQKAIIKIAYHFLCEACIIFLLFVPVMHYQYSPVPYWRYIAILVGVSLVATVIASKRKSMENVLFATMLPVLLLLFIVCGFPVILSAAMSVLLTWRYISISKQPILEREMFYIKASFFIAAFDIAVMKEVMAFVYTGFIFLFVIDGFFTSQFVSVDKTVRDETMHKWKGALYFPLFMLGPSLIFLFAKGDQFVYWLWKKIINAVVYVATLPLYLLSLFDIDLNLFKAEDKELPEDNGDAVQPEYADHGQSLAEQATPYAKWILTALLLIVLIVVVIRLLKRKNDATELAAEQLTETIFEKREKESGSAMKKMKSMLKHFPSRQRHPARKMVLSFEKKMREKGLGRASSETIEEWMGRIGLKDQLEIYQKVRYGEKDVTKKELKSLSKKLQHFVEEIAGRN